MKKENKRFRIYTELLNEDKIKELLSISFDGFTCLKGEGYWKGTKENCFIVEIITKNETLIKAICQQIKKFNKQDAVLYTKESVDCVLV